MWLYTTLGYAIRRLDFEEIKDLKPGDKVVVCTCFDPTHKMVLENATVVRPLFWNSDADEPCYEIETTNGFFDIYSFYEVMK